MPASEFVIRLARGSRAARRAIFILIVSATAVRPQTAPGSIRLQDLLDRIKASAMRYEGYLPDFTCTEVTVKKEDNSGIGTNWRTTDTLEEVVSFASDGRVSKKLTKRNGRPVSRARVGGLSENAVLASAIVPRGIFGPKSSARFEWDHWETKLDHRIAVIAYKSVGFNYPNGKTRYELKVTGRIFYDETDGVLVRMESSNIGPPGYPFGETRQELNYEPITLSGRELILPTVAVMTTARGKRLYRSEIKFLAYRKYESDSSINFGENR